VSVVRWAPLVRSPHSRLVASPHPAGTTGTPPRSPHPLFVSSTRRTYETDAHTGFAFYCW